MALTMATEPFPFPSKIPDPTSIEAAASTAILSLENGSTDTPSTAAPIIIGASVASVLIFLFLIFLSIWLRRRRNQKAELAFINHTFPPTTTQQNSYQNQHNYPSQPDTATYPLQSVSKLDFLPPEPEAPPPYHKDTEYPSSDSETDFTDTEDKDIEAAGQSSTPSLRAKTLASRSGSHRTTASRRTAGGSKSKKPPLPPKDPKDMVRTYVRTRGNSAASTPWGSRPATRPVSTVGGPAPVESSPEIQHPVPAVKYWRQSQEGAAF